MRSSILLPLVMAYLGLSQGVASGGWWEIPDPFERPGCMSRDGSGVVYGEYVHDDGRVSVGRWTRAEGLELVDPLNYDAGDATAVACSEDGRAVLASAAAKNIIPRNFVAYRNGNAFWFASDTYEPYYYGLSRNGKVAVGSTPDYWVSGERREFVYPTSGLASGISVGCSANGDVIVSAVSITYEDGIEWVGFRYVVSENRYTRFRNANGAVRPAGCSRNGKVIFGYLLKERSVNGRSQVAAIWKANRTWQQLGYVGEQFSSATLASNTGNVIVGVAGNGPDGRTSSRRCGFVWTKKRGAVQMGHLGGNVQGVVQVFPEAMTSNGKVVVGNTNIDGEDVAFIWTRETGIHPLLDVLKLTLKDSLKGYFIRGVYGMSLDGRQMCLYVGKPDRSRGAVFVTLPRVLKFPGGTNVRIAGSPDVSAALASAEEALANDDVSSAALTAYQNAATGWAASAAAEYVQGDEVDEPIETLILRAQEQEQMRTAAEQAILSFVDQPSEASYETWEYAAYACAEAAP